MRQFILTSMLLLSGLMSIAQSGTSTTTDPTITSAIPASPDAAALGKYGNIPVSPYTGVLNISVPLYNIKTGSISLPVSLSYHAGGNKIEEIASSVGLGWALNAGGAITRTIRGFADEMPLGLLDPNQYVPNIIATINGASTYNQTQLNTYLNEIGDGTMDGESDMYNFNFAGYSGRFVMNSLGAVMVIPQQNIKFTFAVNNASTPYIQSFTAVTPDGITYNFGSNNDGNDAVEKTYASSSCSTPANKKYYASSWFIKQIVDPTGHKITFNYTSENYAIPQAPNQTAYQWYSASNQGAPIPSMPMVTCQSSSTIMGVKLSSVNFENGHISIYAGIGRNDLPNSKRIDSIAILSAGFSKLYKLFYTDNTGYRLRLDSLTGYLNLPGLQAEKYKFQYGGDVNRTSTTLYQQDWWGYYNGASNNYINGQPTLIPAASFTPNGSSTATTLPGADRATNEGNMIAGMLTQITYPEGGYTTFSYEANHESNIDLNGTSSSYPSASYQIAKSNDPASPYYNYDSNHSNPNDMMKLTSPSINPVAVGIFGTGFETNNPDSDAVTSKLIAVDSLGNPLNGVGGAGIGNTDTIINLQAGYYKIVVSDPKGQAYNGNSDPHRTVKYAIDINWQIKDARLQNNYIVGGLRVKSVSDYDGVNINPVNVKTYQYMQPANNYSSGWIDYQPVYDYYLGVNGGDPYSGIYTNTFFTRSSVSNYPLATTQGSVVGYSHVTELTSGNGQNGKVEYFYTNSQSDPDLGFGYTLPFAPPMSHDWRRGLLLRQITSKANGSAGYIKVQDKANGYSSNYQLFNNELKAAFNPKPSIYGENNMDYNGNYPDGKVVINQYTDFTDFTILTLETTTDYSVTDTTKKIVTSNTYTYDPVTYQLTKSQTTNSKGELVTKTITYPYNYTTIANPSGSSFQGVLDLQAKNIVSYPIEEVTQKANADGSNLRTEHAILTTYKPSQAVRDSVYELRAVGNITNFVNSSAGTNYINKDSRYQPVLSFDSYDAYGNILQEKKVGDALTSYIWGYVNSNSPYNNTYPIAKVINAGAGTMAYTNFESYPTGGTGYGNWTYSNSGTTTDATAPMGSLCYQTGSGAITKSGLTSATGYVVSLWAKQGAAVTVTGGTVTAKPAGATLNGWTYYEYSVSGTTSVSIGGSGYIDELRLYPVNAQMSTYTYVPLVGISSACNVKNQISYYQYDNVGRLITIKDQYGNIIKALNYHYQGQ